MSDIFFIDDSKDEALLTSILLRSEDEDLNVKFFLTFEAVCAELDARNATGEPLPEMVVVDLNMPTMDGTEVVSVLKGVAAYKGLRVGVCTGSADSFDRRRSFKAGADFFVVKPFGMDKLAAAREQVASKHMHQSTEMQAAKA